MSFNHKSDLCETCVWDACVNKFCAKCDGNTYYRAATATSRIAELEAENRRLKEALNVICALNTAETMKRAAWKALASGKDGDA